LIRGIVSFNRIALFDVTSFLGRACLASFGTLGFALRGALGSLCTAVSSVEDRTSASVLGSVGAPGGSKKSPITGRAMASHNRDARSGCRHAARRFVRRDENLSPAAVLAAGDRTDLPREM
jgi:hypothetical protein